MPLVTLVLVPTATELDLMPGLPAGDDVHIEIAGFGPVAAAARTAALVATLRPARVLLLGIAGTYDEQRLAIGTASSFTEVAIDGIGAGEGERLRGPRALGFAQWAPPAATPIFDRILLQPLDREKREDRLLVTCCAASDGEAMAKLRAERYRPAWAEDMEGFGVALACRMAGTPLTVIRGVSNRVGDRDRGRWQVQQALSAAVDLAAEFLHHRMVS